LPQPILTRKAVDPREGSFIVGDDGIAERNGLRGNEQVVAADRSALSFKAGANEAASHIGRRLDGENVKGDKYCFKLSREPRRSLLRSPITQFRCDDDASADLPFANPADVLKLTVSIWTTTAINEVSRLDHET